MTRRFQWLTWLIVGLVVIRLLTMWLLPMADTTEPRYADIARMMAQTGDWITPWFKHGVPFWGKPPLSFWAQALSIKVFGVSAFAARFPAWLVHLISLGLIMSAARAMGDRRQALWTGLLFSSMALPFAMAGAVLTDPYLSLGTTLTLVAFLHVLGREKPSRLWGYLFFLGLAIGFLAKGPVAIVLSGGPIFLWCLWSNGWKKLWERLPWITGTLLALAVALPWYILAEIKTPGFLKYFIVGENFKRFLDPGWGGDRYGTAHKHVYGTIWLYWLLATLPWGLVWLTSLVRKALGKGPLSGKSGFFQRDEHRLLLIWSLFAALFFTFAGNILWTYLLPSTPAVALLVVRWLARDDQPLPDRLAKGLMTGAVALPLLATAAGVYISFHPALIKTDIALVRTYRDLPHPDQDALYYMPERSFSGRYYSGGTARTITLKALQSKRAQSTGPIYIAIEKYYVHEVKAAFPGSLKMVRKGRNFSLYVLPGSSEKQGTTP